MNTKRYFVAPIALCLLITFSGFYLLKDTFPGAKGRLVPFETGSLKLTDKSRGFLDSIFDELVPGESVRLELLSVEERKESKEFITSVSATRARLCLNYITKLGAKLYEQENYISSFPLTKIPATRDYSYQSVLPGIGLHSVMLTKPKDFERRYGGQLVDAEPICETFTVHRFTGAELSRGSFRVIIPPDAFETLYGRNPLKNNVELCISAYKKPHDIVLSGLTTTCNKRMLQTGGMIYIKATCDGETLRLRKDKKIAIALAVDNYSSNYKTFGGTTHNGIVDWEPLSNCRVESEVEGRIEQELQKIREAKQEDGSDNETDWEGEYYGERSFFPQGKNSGVLIQNVYRDYENSPDNLLMESSTLGWINCDEFYDVKKPVNLLVDIGEKNDSVAVRIIFTKIKSVLPAYIYSPDNKVKFASIPAGEDAYVLGIKRTGSMIYFDMQRVVVGETNEVELALAPVSEAAFKKAVSVW